MARAAIWAERVVEFRQSGQSATKFAEGREFTAHQLCYWNVKMRRADGAAGGITPDCAPARVRVARVVRVAAAGPVGGPLAVEIYGARVVVAGGFDRAIFSAVLDELDVRATRAGLR
jgi:hypothetical protein